MELRPEQLVAKAASEPLKPAYLIAGAETLRVVEAADAVREKARAEGISEREVFDAEGRENPWAALEATFNAPSLFSPRRLVELRMPGGKPGKEGSEVLLQFCASPPPDVVLLITCGEWGKAYQTKWAEAVAKLGVLCVAWPIKPHELPEWIEKRLREHGLSADNDAVQALSERMEGNLLAAAQEIDKLALLLGRGGRLDLATMQSLVADAARYDVFRLTDAALDGQAALVGRMLAGLRAEGEQVAGLMYMVTKELLRCASLARAQARGANLAAEMKSQGVWEAKQAPYRRALARHSPAHWERFVAIAGRVDQAAKGRGEGDPWILLERLLLAVAETKAKRLLVA